MMDAATKAVVAQIHARRGVIGEQIAALRKEDADLETSLKVVASLYLGEDAVAQPVVAARTPEPMPQTARAHTPAPAPRVAPLVDASTLRPLTDKQAATFRALCRACDEGSRPTLSTIAEYAGLTASANAIYQLEALRRYGYADNFGDRGAPDWRPTAFGQVRIIAEADRAQPWTDDQIEGLHSLDPAKGDSYQKFAEKYGRTAAAVEQQARNLRCYRRGLGNMRAKARVLKSKRRFTDHSVLDPEGVRGLKADSPAIVEGRTMFPSTVVNPADSPALLVSGANSRKLGDRVTKGEWAGFPIYQLSLEERATCPKSCHHWLTCYGNGMPQARRHRHGPELVDYLRAELTDLQEENPVGFVVRLHVLGDFYSLDYVREWNDFLDAFPALHIFGYTAWPKNSEIGAAILGMTDTRWDRFAIRFSSAEAETQGAAALWRKPEDLADWPGIICPAQTAKTDCCGTCGLCWAASAKDKTIGFIAHGRVGAPKNAAPVRHPSKDMLSPEAQAFQQTPAKPYPKIAGPMTTIVRRVSDPSHEAAPPRPPSKTSKADFNAAKAIADFVAAKGVRRLESGASGQTYNMVDWLRIHCGIEARATKHGSRPAWEIGRRKYSLPELYIFVNEQRKRRGLEALTVAA